MTPATAATQKVGRAATCRSYSGCAAARCLITNAAAAAATTASPMTSAPLPGTGAKLMSTMSAATGPRR